MDRGPDFAPLNRRFAWAVVACDEQEEAISGVFSSFKGQVDRPPSAVEAVAVKIDGAIGLKGA